MKQGRHHVMERVSFQAEGTQEWRCPHCGRHLRFHWSSPIPLVLAAGDESVLHVDRQVEGRLVTHESGLSALWLVAIAALDMEALTEDAGLSPLWREAIAQLDMSGLAG